MEESNEVMEPMVEDNNVEIHENSDSCEKKSSLGILAGAAAVGAAGILLYRKLRKKKTGKKKLMWVEIPDDPDEKDVVELEEETTEIETSEEA